MLEEWLDLASANWLREQLSIGLFVAARIGGMIAALPVLTAGLPIRMRLVLVFAISIVVIPNLSASDVSMVTSSYPAETALACGRSFVFGVLIGGIAQLLVMGVSLAGELIASAAGLQLAQTADPTNGQSTPQFARLLGLMVTAMFLASGGHRLVIDALLASFEHGPAMSTHWREPLFAVLTDHMTTALESGLRVAAPVVSCVLLTNLIVAILSRTAPQLNALTIGLNLNLLAVVIVLAITVGSAGLVFESELSNGLERLGSITSP